VDLASKYGFTALHIAVMSRSVSCVKVLVRGGAELNQKNDDGETALDRAVAYSEQECGEYLHSVGAKCFEEEYPSDWKQ